MGNSIASDFQLAEYKSTESLSDSNESNGQSKKLTGKPTAATPSKGIWENHNGNWYKNSDVERQKKLPNKIYQLKLTNSGFHLQELYDKFTFEYKIYGLENKLINRIKKTFENTSGNLGVIFNGTKGTGKTVTAKQLCNSFDCPVIIISENFENAQYFVNNQIQQNIIIFVDEYEKIFSKESELLTIMDGAMNSTYRRFFLLTTNSLYINENLKQRPTRIRYIKEFTDLSSKITEEIVDDFLLHKKHKTDILKFITSLEIITIDIVKSIINEVNIHNESPFEFQDLFNVKKLDGRYNIFIINNNVEYELFTNVSMNLKFPITLDPFQTFNLNIYHIGYIQLSKQLSERVFEASISLNDFHDEALKMLITKLTNFGVITKTQLEKLTNINFNEEKIDNAILKNMNVKIIIRIERAFILNSNYISQYNYAYNY